DAIGAANIYDPTQPVYDPNSQYGGYSTWTDGSGNYISLSPRNPVALLNVKDDTSEVRRLLGNAKVDYKLHFFPDLTATVNVALDKSNSNGRTILKNWYPTTDEDAADRDYYSLNTYSQERTDKLLDAYLTYQKTFNEIHNLTIVAGYSYQSFEYDAFSYSSLDELQALESPDSDIQYEYIDKSKSVLLSYFGRLNYDYKGKYLLTTTLRADASSKLNPDDRWGIFPSAALAWNISKEDFMQSVSLFDELKL